VFGILEAMAFTSWRSRTEEHLAGVAYIIDDIVNDLTAAYVVTPNSRRTGDRRSGTSRRGAQIQAREVRADEA